MCVTCAWVTVPGFGDLVAADCGVDSAEVLAGGFEVGDAVSVRPALLFAEFVEGFQVRCSLVTVTVGRNVFILD
jgi:hypothetical protein